MKAFEGFDILTQKYNPAVMGTHEPLDPFETLKSNTAGVTVNSVAGTAITITRTSATRATRDSGVWIKRVIIDISAIVAAGAYTNFVVGETITETTSNSTGVVEEVSTTRLVMKTITKAFTGGKTLTGGTSNVTATGGTATNVIEDLRGKFVWSYVNADGVGTGKWTRVIGNIATYLDIDGTLLTSADRIIIADTEAKAREAMDVSYGS
jgi:hypothetical protein